MSWLPESVQEMIDAALVTELTVVRRDGRPITYPVIPLWDGASILMTSSILFSRKLEHMKDNPRVSLSFSDPVALGGRQERATIQCTARVLDSEPHAEWERVLPIWSAKEPSVLQFLKVRVAFPLYFERGVVEFTPVRLFRWPDGDTSRPPEITDAPSGAGATDRAA